MIDQPLFWGAVALGPVVYWRLSSPMRAPFLATLCLAVLAQSAPISTLVVLVLTMFVAWSAHRARRAQRPLLSTALIVVAVVSTLLVAKYQHLVTGLWIGVPLGISYLAFKLIHYAVEVGRGRIEPHRPADVLVWTSLFPAFVAGPIERFDHFLAHREDAPSREAVVLALTRIAQGLIKKLLLADTIMAPWIVDAARVDAELAAWSTIEAWQHVIVVFLWGYLDFSGYTDIALGAARLFGLRLMENFDRPLLAPNIAQFWRRWHMTLAGFCQTYIYMPALGVTRSPYLATYATFLVMGLWHGVSGNWLCWGLWHGTGVATYLTYMKLSRRHKWHRTALGRVPAWLGIAPTFLFVSAAAAFTSTHRIGWWPGMRLFAKLFGVDLDA